MGDIKKLYNYLQSKKVQGLGSEDEFKDGFLNDSAFSQRVYDYVKPLFSDIEETRKAFVDGFREPKNNTAYATPVPYEKKKYYDPREDYSDWVDKQKQSFGNPPKDIDEAAVGIKKANNMELTPQEKRQERQAKIAEHVNANIGVERYNAYKEAEAQYRAAITSRLDADIERAKADKRAKEEEINKTIPQGSRALALFPQAKMAVQWTIPAYTLDVLEDTKELLEAPTKGSNWAGSMWAGFRDNADIKSFLSLGMSTFAKTGKVYDICSRYTNGEKLTDEETNLLEALAMNTAVAGLRAGDISGWYRSGEVTGDMVEIIGQFLLTGGIGTGASKVVSKAIGKTMQKILPKLVSKMGAKGAVGTVLRGAKFAGKGAVDVVAGGAAQSIYMPSTYSGYWEKKSGTVTHGDKDGEYNIEPSKINDLQAMLSSMAETGTERLGGAFVGAGSKILKNIVPKSWAKLSTKGAIGALIKAGGTANKYMAKAGVNSTMGELSEEFAGAAFDKAIGASSDEEWKAFWSKDNMLQMIGGFAPMSMFGLGMNGATIANKRLSALRYKRKFVAFTREAGSKEGVKMAEDILNAPIEDLGNKMHKYTQEIGGYTDGELNDKGVEFNYFAAEMLRRSTERNIADEWDSDIRQEAEDNVNTGDKRTIDDTVDDTEQMIPQVQQGDEVEYDSARWIVGSIAEEDGEYTFGEESIPLKKGNVLMFEADGNGVRILDSVADLYTEDNDNGIESRRQEVYEKYRPVMNIDTGNIIQLSSTADNDNIAYVIKGRIVYDEEGNIDYDKSDDTIYYKVYDKEGNEVDGGTPRPLHLKTHRTEFGKVLSDTPIEEYVDNELYPQDETEQSSATGNVSTDEHQGVTEENNKVGDNWNEAQDKISDILDYAIKNKTEYDWEDIADVSEDEARRINESTGLNIDSEYKHIVESSAINHVLNRHGEGKEKDDSQTNITKEDFELIPEIISMADKITLGSTRQGLPAIVYEKTFADGTTFYIEEVRQGRKKLALKTMYKKKLAHSVAPMSENSPNSRLTPSTDHLPTSTGKGSINNWNIQNTILSDEEADLLISAMEQNAEAMQNLELNYDNWLSEFGRDGIVDTPIGSVKMGDNQFLKMSSKERQWQFGMVRPTLTNPDIIIEEPSEARVGQSTERGSSYLFVKTFDVNGERIRHFESITVKKDGLEVSVSSHIIKPAQLKSRLLNGSILWSKPQIANSIVSGEQQTLDDSRIQDPNANNHGSEVRVSTDGKGTTKNRNTQNTVLNNKPELTSIGSEGYLTETRDGQSDLVPTQEANSDSQGKGTTNNLNEQEEFYNSLPRNKKGEVDENLMSAEQKIRYAQIEFGEDLDLVKDYITEQSKALSEKIAKLTNKTGKSVAEYKELAALKADKNVFVDYLHSLRDMQEDSMPRQTVEEAAAKREESRREEQAQREQMVREKEEREGVPDFLQDTPEDARLRGFRLRTGERINRQSPIEIGKYNTARRKFTNDTGAVEGGRPTVKRTIIDNAQTKLQPSHRGGRANIYHFITEAQPKERTDKASRVSAAQIAANINPEEITGGITAYNGSPIANNRLEVIQGNNRAEALRLMYEEYPQSAETYKQYLIDNAEDYGMSADEVRTMKEPIAVDIYEGTDGNAILLGQYTQQDVESGGVHRINPSGVVKHLKSHNMLDRFITGLLKGVDEENTVSDVISANLRDVLPILDKTGAISMTQRQGFFDERGDVTSGAIDDFKGILTSLITEGGYANINSDFLNLPDSAKTALYLQTYRAVLNKQDGPTILNDIQNSILLYTLVFGNNNKGKVGVDESRREVMSWLMTAQPDFNTLNEDGTYPLVDMRKKFSNFAAELAILYKSTNLRSSKDKGRGLYNIWDDFYNLLEGKGDLFTTGEKKSLQESINENFNIDYVPIRQNERNTLDSGGEASRAGRRDSESELGVGEQSEAGTAATDDRGRTETDIAEAVKEIDVEPTEAQKKAGNYKKGHVKIQGFDITIENPKGAIRRGVDDNGKAWSTEMKNHYGYFKNTEGKDGDHIDVFIGDNPNSKRIFVVDQVNPKTKEFDESKVMLGFDTEDEAQKAYLSNYSKDWKGFKDITYVDIDTFRDWLYDGAKQRKPFGEYSNIRFRSIKDINDRFNEELQQQIDGTLPKGHVYSLGMPNDILRSAGFPNVPIELSASHLEKKSIAAQHPFELKEIKSLVKALQDPMAVFAYGDKKKSQNVIVEIQHEGKNFVVGIHFNRKRGSAEISSIRGLYPKDNAEWLNWISQGKLLYVNKEKIQILIDQQRRNLADVEYLDLNYVAKVIKDFDNPTLSEEKNEETRLKASKRKARGATTEKLEELVTLLKKTGFADVKTGEDFYNALAEIGGSEHYLRPNGTVLGFVKGNTIYLNPDEVSLNTPIHEFGHLWVSQVKGHFPELWAKGKELFLESDYLRKVQADPNYRHLDLDGQIDEAMARAIGDRGEQELDKTLLEKILDWIAEVWEKIGGVFGIDNLTSEQISNLTLQDFTDMATSELLSGQSLTERVNGNRGGVTRYNTADETADIKARSIADGTFMKAPNGKDTNLTERQWLQVRTKAFKRWFGDWEKTARIEKLKKTKPIEITGEEYKGKYELNRDSAKAYIKDSLRGEYTNKDTGDTILLAKDGAQKVTSHSMGNEAHLKSIAVIPELIEKSIFIDELPNEKNNGKYDSYRYYVSGLKIGGVDYTVKLAIGIDEYGNKYYDHSLTEIEKGKLIDEVGALSTTLPSSNQSALSEYKDSKLISLLQENSSKVVDENGEPLVVYHGTNKFGFTVFDKEFSDDKTSVFFTDRVDIAKGYAGVNADVRSLYDDDTAGGYSKDEILSMLFADVDISSHTNGWDVANDILPYITEDIGITAEYDDEDGVLTLSSDYTGDTYRLTDEEFSWEKVENWLRDNADLENVIDKDAGIYGVFVNAHNVLDIDAGGSMWSSIHKKKVKGAEGVGNMDTRDIVEHAKKLNYDGVYIKDLLDTGGRGYGLVGDIEGDIFISLVDKNQIKSATDNIGTFNEEDEDIRYLVEGADYFVNERFNEQLEHLTEANADSTIFYLGEPSAEMLAVGIKDSPLKLYGNKLQSKAKKHGFDVKDVRDLPEAIHDPIAIFEGAEDGSFAILTELSVGDNNVLATLSVGKGNDVDFNIVNSVYGKYNKNVVGWINKGKTLYVNKEKALDYLRISAPIAEAQDKGELNLSASAEKTLAWQAALAPIASATLKQDLITATKVIENFENPPINEKKVIDDTTNDMVRYSIKASEQLDKEDEVMGERAAEIYEARVKMGKQMNQSNPNLMPNKKIFDEINEKTENRRAKIAEHAADCYLPMKHLIEVFNKHGYNVSDYNNWYMNVFALAGKNEAEYEKYQAERSVPLQRAAKVAMDSGNITYRDLENYLILKHGQERNKYYKERDEKLGVKPMKDYSGTEAVMFEEFCKRTGIEVKTIEKSIPELVDGDPNTIQYGKGDSEFSKDGKKIPAFEVNKRFELWRKQHTPEDIIEDYEGKISKEKVEDLWAKIRKATQFTLDCQKEGGLTSEAMYEKASGMWEYFVPLRGFDMGTAQDEYDYDLNGITLFTDFRVEQTLGRTRRSVSPLAWTEQMAHITIQQKNKNLLNQSLRRLASVSTARKDNIMFLSKQYKEPDVIENGKVVKKGALIYPPAYTGDPQIDGAAFERWDAAMKEGVKNGTIEVVEHSNVNFGMIVPKGAVKQHVVRVYEGGRPVDIIFNTSPSVPRAINGLNHKAAISNHWIYKNLQAGTRLIARAKTTWNPAFVGKNFMRDYLFANTMLMGKEDRTYRANFNKNIVKARSVMFDYVRGKSLLGWAVGDKGSVRDNEYGRLLTEFVMNGGKTGFSQMLKFEKMSSDFKKQTERGDKKVHYLLNDYIHFIEAMNDYAENITRFAAYCTSRQAGRSIERSISDAKELTINFNRKGTDGGIWGTVRSLSAYCNASIQALVVFSRGVRANPKRMGAIISSYVAMPIAMAIVASLVGGDDYFKLSKYDRQNNICIPMFGGGFVKIPLPQELRVFWKLGDEIALCIYRNEPPEVAAQEVFMGALDLLPSFAAGATSIGDVTGGKMSALEFVGAHNPITILQPITQVMANRNFLNYRIYDDNKWGGRRKELPEYRKALRNKGGETYSPNFAVKLSEGISRLTGGSDLKRGVVEVNPDIMNHFMRGYFGGLYNTAVAAINMGDKGAQSIAAGEWRLKSTDSPTMKAFYVSPSNLRYTDDILNAQYMDVLKEAKKHADVYANYLKEGEVDRFEEETKMTEDEALDWRYLVKGIDKEVQELRNEIATAETTKERDEALRQLEALQREAIDMAEKLKK